MANRAVYGHPPPALADAGAEAIQFSPLVPGAMDLAAAPDSGFDAIVVAAPPGVLERRYVLAHALRALAPDGRLTALAPKTRGGARLRAELEAFGCTVAEIARRHHRICETRRPAAAHDLEEAMAAGAPQWVEGLGLWSQPGIFSWNRIDGGTAFLIPRVGELSGRGADLGCGLGVLARAVLGSAAVSSLVLADLDARALAAARRNLDDPRARLIQADARVLPGPDGDADLRGLDFVVSNPPFHVGGREDVDLGRAFIAAAARMLRNGGLCRLVANAALPYEQALASHFREVRLLAQGGGYKAYEARR